MFPIKYLQLNEELEQFEAQVNPSWFNIKFSGHWQTLVGWPVLFGLGTSKHRASHPPLFSQGLKSGSGWRIGWKTWKKSFQLAFRSRLCLLHHRPLGHGILNHLEMKDKIRFWLQKGKVWIENKNGTRWCSEFIDTRWHSVLKTCFVNFFHPITCNNTFCQWNNSVKIRKV